MKRMDLLRELRTSNITELKTKINELKTQLLNMRVKLKGRELKNPLSLRMLRRDVAVVNTILREKEKQGDRG
ncbi:50S ribosomal protein L29 [Candidatus Desantisbacteria bacterium CG1_02_38_46]|uniref:Large ribosomal subunit protein uL29 n=3 Tax=unclassified Candidatus Desantisiibacteriota TaxID=3106372 RepID=A0A2H9PCH7_9BACT|nr:MAG: 50S ribosomal protein L29 [Candidatus Desantisbacteria bacterium CG1_02_38_46]PIU51322.1 MAG: 50S ribosomal protein L29 [Candidatus Desantisbacteria bacterium CG07_land_8_20_14_0_80_39_15]PIZ16946.1 MAG: 50S ribosomal protein L29 [Candidatus Desantisbacteria bacterium CG_4_10_14_0_8_um_filter_39_17]